MPATRQYSQTLALEPTDAILIDRIGVGTLWIEAENLIPGLEGNLITASGVNLGVGQVYGVKTSLGAFSGTLPALSTTVGGEYIEVQDVDYDAGANHYTINAFPGDHIADHGNVVTSYVMNISNVILRFMANNNGTWQVVFYGA